MRLAVVVVLAACSSTPKQPPVEPKPVEPALDAACPPMQDITLADGKLRCRELPFTLDFPEGTSLKRIDDSDFTFLNATLDRGVLAVFAEPRFDVQDDKADIKTILEAVATKIAEDATITEVAAPPLAGAQISNAITFTTTDGGAGVAYGYVANNWLFGVFAGGRKTDTPTRPDQPVGKAFLASLKLRTVSSAWVPHEALGAKISLPAAAWERVPGEGKTDPQGKLWVVPHERVWIAVRELDPSPQCAMFANVKDEQVPAIVKQMFGKDDLKVTGKLAKVGTQALYAEIETPGGMLAMYIVCQDPKVNLVTVTGKRPIAEIKALLEQVTKPFAR